MAKSSSKKKGQAKFSFKKGQKVIKVLMGPCDSWTSSLEVVAKVSKGVVTIDESSWQVFDAVTGKSKDDPLPGFSSRIVVFEG